MIIPEGWKLVPLEPTAEMIKAAEQRIDDFKDSGYDTGGDDSTHSYEYFLSGVEEGIYKAMINAAPSYSKYGERVETKVDSDGNMTLSPMNNAPGKVNE